jgi:hypothetical protein
MKPYPVVVIALLCANTVAQADPAAQAAAPLGIVLGNARCSALIAQGDQPVTDAVSHAKFGWAGGADVQVVDLPRFHMATLVRATVDCNATDKVVAVQLTFEKDIPDLKNVHEIARVLDSRYPSVRKHLPDSANGFALWNASNATVEMSYFTSSGQFQLSYWAPGARERYSGLPAAVDPGRAVPGADQFGGQM